MGLVIEFGVVVVGAGIAAGGGDVPKGSTGAGLPAGAGVRPGCPNGTGTGRIGATPGTLPVLFVFEFPELALVFAGAGVAAAGAAAGVAAGFAAGAAFGAAAWGATAAFAAGLTGAGSSANGSTLAGAALTAGVAGALLGSAPTESRPIQMSELALNTTSIAKFIRRAALLVCKLLIRKQSIRMIHL
jgi:hypothetical protein